MLIGPRHVLIAAHVVHRAGRGRGPGAYGAAISFELPAVGIRAKVVGAHLDPKFADLNDGVQRSSGDEHEPVRSALDLAALVLERDLTRPELAQKDGYIGARIGALELGALDSLPARGLGYDGDVSCLAPNVRGTRGVRLLSRNLRLRFKPDFDKTSYIGGPPRIRNRCFSRGYACGTSVRTPKRLVHGSAESA